MDVKEFLKTVGEIVDTVCEKHNISEDEALVDLVRVYFEQKAKAEDKNQTQAQMLSLIALLARDKKAVTTPTVDAPDFLLITKEEAQDIIRWYTAVEDDPSNYPPLMKKLVGFVKQ